MSNIIFIHACNTQNENPLGYGIPEKNRCQEILDGISNYILSSGILSVIDEINLELIGNQNIFFEVPKSKINYNGVDIKQWEFPTLEKIISHSKKNPKDKILYIHTRGSSRPKSVPDFEWIEKARNYRLHQCINRFEDCLNFLEEYDTCGPELIHNPVTHYSHNFWWAKCSHINNLPEPKSLPVIYELRHNAEFWVCSKKGKFKSIFNIYDDHLKAISWGENLYLKQNNSLGEELEQKYVSHLDFTKGNL